MWQGFSECSLAGSLHTHILIVLNTFPDSVKVETSSASAACSKSGLPLCITELQGAVSLRSALDGLAHQVQVHAASRECDSPDCVLCRASWCCSYGEIHYILPKEWRHCLHNTFWDLDTGCFLSGARQKPELIQPVCLMKNTRENYEILGYLKQSQIHKLVWP